MNTIGSSGRNAGVPIAPHPSAARQPRVPAAVAARATCDSLRMTLCHRCWWVRRGSCWAAAAAARHIVVAVGRDREQQEVEVGPDPAGLAGGDRADDLARTRWPAPRAHGSIWPYAVCRLPAAARSPPPAGVELVEPLCSPAAAASPGSRSQRACWSTILRQKRSVLAPKGSGKGERKQKRMAPAAAASGRGSQRRPPRPFRPPPPAPAPRPPPPPVGRRRCRRRRAPPPT